MKKTLFLFTIFFLSLGVKAQEIQANVIVSSQQIAGSNNQVFQTLQKSLREFINNTSWTGKKLQPFERIKCNLAIVISERPTQNSFKGNIVIQSVRPVYGSIYESPLMNINDQNFAFEYTENENLIFNERQFSGKNLIDVISFYIYLILGYDADTFEMKSGQPWFDKAMKIAQNSQGQNFPGWNRVEGPKTRGGLIESILAENNAQLRTLYYQYHRNGMDNMSQDEQTSKRIIYDQLMGLKTYEDNFQMNNAFNTFLDAKKTEIYNIFANGNNGVVQIQSLQNLMTRFAPNSSNDLWSKWK